MSKEVRGDRVRFYSSKKQIFVHEDTFMPFVIMKVSKWKPML